MSSKDWTWSLRWIEAETTNSGLSFPKGKMGTLDQNSSSQMVFQGAPQLSADASGIGGLAEEEAKRVRWRDS